MNILNMSSTWLEVVLIILTQKYIDCVEANANIISLCKAYGCNYFATDSAQSLPNGMATKRYGAPYLQ